MVDISRSCFVFSAIYNCNSNSGFISLEKPFVVERKDEIGPFDVRLEIIMDSDKTNYFLSQKRHRLQVRTDLEWK